MHGGYVAPVDREPEPGRRARGMRPARRWILTGPTPGAELQSFDRRAIALRALHSAADGSQLIDGLTGEVLATATDLDPP
jgi:DNA excision repair protein ERCC-4/Fanconi anemia group M protein